ncbi:hypothetical protein [Scytonema sp. NUACC26]|uniref:hypothetical protein n=1 Tax=Scytonema sp. NUACC26 TaxID=3140176 RepID=UPI0034DBDFA6
MNDDFLYNTGRFKDEMVEKATIEFYKMKEELGYDYAKHLSDKLHEQVREDFNEAVKRAKEQLTPEQIEHRKLQLNKPILGVTLDLIIIDDPYYPIKITTDELIKRREAIVYNQKDEYDEVINKRIENDK